AAVRPREDLDEARAIVRPLLEDFLRAPAAREPRVTLDEVFEYRFIGFAPMPEVARELPLLLGVREHRLEVDHRGVAALREVAVEIESGATAAGPAGGEVASGGAQDRHGPARHVLAAVVAHTLDDRFRAGIAHREALARDAAEEGLARDRAVEHDIAGDD